MKIGKFNITKWFRDGPAEWRREVYCKDYIGNSISPISFETGYAGCFYLIKGVGWWHLGFGWNIFKEEHDLMYGDSSPKLRPYPTLKEAKSHINLFLRKLKKLKAFTCNI